jgi:hypothetical protein
MPSSASVAVIFLKNRIGTLVGTTAIAAKCEDVSLGENLGMGARGVLISPSIQCRASHCTINADVCHWASLLGCGSDPRNSGSSSVEQCWEENCSRMLTWTAAISQPRLFCSPLRVIRTGSVPQLSNDSLERRELVPLPSLSAPDECQMKGCRVLPNQSAPVSQYWRPTAT